MPGRDLLDRHRSLRVLVSLVIIVIVFNIINVVWNVLTNFGDILLLFFLAWVITFILEPVSAFLASKRVFGRPVPRLLAVSLVYLALLIVISGTVVLAVPAIQAQVTQIAQLVQGDLSGARLARLSAGLVRALERLGFSPRDATNIVSQLLTQIPKRTQDATNQAIASASSLVTTVTTILFDASLVVILSFYMMLDGGRLIDRLIEKLPPSWECDVRLFQGYVNDIFGGFFRAQLIVASIYALMTWVIMLALQTGNGAFLAAFLAGAFMLLPFIGAFLAIVPPALLVLLQTPPDALLPKLVLMIVLLGAAQHVVLNLLAPRIYGQHLGIDPIILFGALLLGAQVGGVWGAFFAAPVVAILYAIFETFYERITSTHPLFQPEEGAAENSDGARVGEEHIPRQARTAPGDAALPQPEPSPTGTAHTRGRTADDATDPALYHSGNGHSANGANMNGANGVNGANGHDPESASTSPRHT